MPAKPISVGTLSFKSKTEANDFFRKLLYKYELGDRVSLEDAQYLAALLRMHPEADDKVGAGIESFSVRSADYGTRCFWVNRTDGTTEKFSFKACY